MNTDISKAAPYETPIEYYKRVRIVLEDRINSLRSLLGDAADELDNYIADCQNYEAPEGLERLQKVAQNCRTESQN